MNAKKLFKLIRNDKLDTIEMMSDAEKALLNQPHPASSQFPVHCAAEFDAINVTKFLLEHIKVNINVTDKDGKHCLHYAANNLSQRVLEYFVNG